ncbi:Zn-ribbon domain-containing OB-fold protein [Rhodococcus sp. SORGH_AS_0301]|uniref:Zn-ribbon domain-containing OB-fold protein n=1 Tax=Rhodococcus sp. SORGH_AS_0301 TaxID=3041780 RepID=UPI0027D903E7|nr:OB-fold domain-containing protein [Rhodococcus sp. SORGH_AS_0301]
MEASGNATVYSFTLVHRGAGPFQEEAPYALVAAALAEDPKHCVLLANTVDIPNEELRIGMPVRIAFEDIEGEDTTLWRVGPA